MKTATAAPEPNEDQQSKLVPAQDRNFDYKPQNVTEAMNLAKMLSESDLVPKDYKGKPGNCYIGMKYARELGLEELQGLQSIAVINGKPGIYGDMGKALLLSRGIKIEERDVPDIKAKGQAWCKIVRPNGQVTERTFSLEDAKTANLWGKQGPWSTNPYRQMAWRAFWFAARDGAADILKGIGGVEELVDYTNAVDTTSEPAPRAPRELAVDATVSEPTPDKPVVDFMVISKEERKHIFELLTTFKVSPDQLRKHLKEKYGVDGTDKLPSAKYSAVCDWIENPQEELPVE